MANIVYSIGVSSSGKMTGLNTGKFFLFFPASGHRDLIPIHYASGFVTHDVDAGLVRDGVR